MNPEGSELWSRAIQALRTATVILSEDPDAAGSRAYYAALYAISAMFAIQGKTFSRHSALEVAVHRDLVKTGNWDPDLGKDFSFLLRLRTTGDYGGGMHVSKDEAKEAIESARRILRAVQETSPEPFPKMENDT